MHSSLVYKMCAKRVLNLFLSEKQISINWEVQKSYRTKHTHTKNTKGSHGFSKLVYLFYSIYD